MQRLADIQAAIAKAMISGDRNAVPQSLVGASGGARRFEIHVRHYRASLTGNLIRKFPATQWLTGKNPFATAALEYVQLRAPTTPCIAEYGVDFPEFLARCEHTGHYPYIEPFARLDWLLGRASIAVEEPPLPWSAIAAGDPERLLETRVTFQPGMQFLRAEYPVDEIILPFLAGKEAESRPAPMTETYIAIYGSRGEYSMTKIDPGQFEFRCALHAGRSIGEAASTGLDVDPEFDAGRALRRLADAGLIVSTVPAS